MKNEIQHRDRARQIIDFAGIRLGAKEIISTRTKSVCSQ